MLDHDPIEDTPKFKEIQKELEEKIIAEIGPNSGLGYCHLYWQTKKRILKKEYRIKWKSPAELNKHILFD